MQFDAIGTRWVIETAVPLSAPLQRSIYRRIELFDKIYSRFREDSLVCMLEKKSGTYTFPSDSIDLISWYRELYSVTKGAVTPLVGSSLNYLGYDKSYTLKEQGTKPAELWEDVMTWRGATVTAAKPLSLDFGAAGKGYLVDIIGTLLESDGINEYVIDASGDIRHRGSSGQIVGLEHPADATRVIGTMNLQNQSLCASAINRRQWGDRLHHIVDAHTGRPVDDVEATWVLAENTMVADGIATALFFCDPVQLEELGDYHYVRLLKGGHIEYSKGFVGELFI